MEIDFKVTVCSNGFVLKTEYDYDARKLGGELENSTTVHTSLDDLKSAIDTQVHLATKVFKGSMPFHSETLPF